MKSWLFAIYPATGLTKLCYDPYNVTTHAKLGPSPSSQALAPPSPSPILTSLDSIKPPRPLIYYALDRHLNATSFRNLVHPLRWEDHSRSHIVGLIKDLTPEIVPAVVANYVGDTHWCHQPDFAPFPHCR